MRILIKGGVWKNTEDEILKAAVMKYGLNQWSRISSLLVRKSAKQCKARWYEWLDPAIKKTEWTREEDEKLLHLAKLMPTQWRTIAPIVGRTPSQCLERYEKLLDMAAGREDGYDAKDDPRKLRPGEIDPNPETKPARPDPVDMDEDEKEMLSEARARLANTRGKKAKRKAREKQLEEARRLATLQKKRELKAAGIEVRDKAKRGRGIDYSSEVPFERRPAPGFYDVREENEITKSMREEFRPTTKDELEGRKRKDIEKELIKQDVEKKKIAERKNAPDMVARSIAAHDTSISHRRGKMMLPTPQVTDVELEALAKDGAAMDVALTGSEATRALIGDYQTPSRFATPMRTPAVGPSGSTAGISKVMQEAQALARLSQGQTPLLGGENPDISATDFSGITPRNTVASTPNPLASTANALRSGATPSIAGIAATPKLPGATPAHGGMAQPTPGTQRRDALKLNAQGENGFGDVRQVLSQLPAPKGEYQLAAPEAPQEEEEEEPEMMEDAEEQQARLAAAEEKRKEERRKLQSSVIQRNLPRPLSLDFLPTPIPDSKVSTLPIEEQAEELVKREFIYLLNQDAETFPVQDQNNREPIKELNSGFKISELEAASKLIEEETTVVRQEYGHDAVPLEAYSAEWERLLESSILSPQSHELLEKSKIDNGEYIVWLRHAFDQARQEMAQDAKRASKLEQKATVVLGGLTNRNENLRSSIDTKLANINLNTIELACFKSLQDQEQLAMPSRLQAIQQLVDAQESKERALQDKYKSLVSSM